MSFDLSEKIWDDNSIGIVDVKEFIRLLKEGKNQFLNWDGTPQAYEQCKKEFNKWIDELAGERLI